MCEWQKSNNIHSGYTSPSCECPHQVALPALLSLSLCVFLFFFYLPSHVHVFSVYSSTCLSPALCLQLNACGSEDNMCVWLGV